MALIYVNRGDRGRSVLGRVVGRVVAQPDLSRFFAKPSSKLAGNWGRGRNRGDSPAITQHVKIACDGGRNVTGGVDFRVVLLGRSVARVCSEHAD